MGARSAAREAALQMLFAADLGSQPADAIVGDFWREFPGDPEGRTYADGAVHGVLAERERIDGYLRKASQNWRLERMTAIDRNVLRLGTWELLTQAAIPRAVIIDESVEVAKRYGGKESAAFVNGVLDRVANDCGRALEPHPGGSKSHSKAVASSPAASTPAASSAGTPAAAPTEPEPEPDEN